MSALPRKRTLEGTSKTAFLASLYEYTPSGSLAPQASLAETRQIALAQGECTLRVCDPHRLSELGLRMRADPSNEQKAAQHHEGVDFGLVLGRERADAPITPHPRLDERRHFGTVLEERHRCCAVVKEPGEAAIVEVDDFDGVAVHEQIGKSHVAVDEIEPVGRLAEPVKAPLDEPDSLTHRFETLSRHAHPVPPTAPMRPRAETRFEVPSVAFEPGRTLPGADMGVHAGRDLSQRFESGGVGCGWLLALLPGEEHDIARPRQAVVSNGLNELSIAPSDRCRRDRGARFLERDLPEKFRGDGRP